MGHLSWGYWTKLHSFQRLIHLWSSLRRCFHKSSLVWLYQWRSLLLPGECWSKISSGYIHKSPEISRGPVQMSTNQEGPFKCPIRYQASLFISLMRYQEGLFIGQLRYHEGLFISQLRYQEGPCITPLRYQEGPLISQLSWPQRYSIQNYHVLKLVK